MTPLSGTVDMEEVVSTLQTMSEAAGLSAGQGDKVARRATELFQCLDLNQDGQLAEQEFVKACVEAKEIMAVLNTCG